MKEPSHPYRWMVARIGSLGALAVVAWLGSRWLAAEPGSARDVFSRLRVGMTQDEAVRVLRTHNSIDGAYSEGMTRDGRPFGALHLRCPLFGDLPPAGEVERCVLTVSDNY